MKKFDSDLTVNPSFNSVTELTNISFNPNNYLENRMATEAQIFQLYQDIVAAEQRQDYCCRDIIIWEASVQVVRLNTLDINPSNNTLRGGGEVISSFDENKNVGTMRRGLKYTITFPLKWDNSLYVKRDVSSSSTSCALYTGGTGVEFVNVHYRIVEDNSIVVSDCTATSTTYKAFWRAGGDSLRVKNDSTLGHILNRENVWDNFIHQVASDGTVTIKDLRMNTNFNIIRYYTQWILRQTADGQTIPDPE